MGRPGQHTHRPKSLDLAKRYNQSPSVVGEQVEHVREDRGGAKALEFWVCVDSTQLLEISLLLAGG